MAVNININNNLPIDRLSVELGKHSGTGKEIRDVHGSFELVSGWYMHAGVAQQSFMSTVRI
jgi:hypothetical protein